MVASTSSDESDRPTCYRCDDPLGEANCAQLSTEHRGTQAEHFQDVDRRICLDCLAAIGLLEFAVDGTERRETSAERLKHRLAPIRALRGDD